MQDYTQLKYVMRCVNESMRLYPHPPVLLRRAMVQDQLPGAASLPYCLTNRLTECVTDCIADPVPPDSPTAYYDFYFDCPSDSVCSGSLTDHDLPDSLNDYRLSD